jgi:hypothetical protein
LIQTTEDHRATSLYVPGSKYRGMEGRIQQLPACTTQMDALMALSLLDTVTRATDADEKIVNVRNDIQDFASKINKRSLKERSTESYFNPLKPNGNCMSHLLQQSDNYSFCIYEFCRIFNVNRNYFLNNIKTRLLLKW